MPLLLITHTLSAGPSLCHMLSVLLRDTKTNSTGKFFYSGSIRNSNPVLCSHNALAFLFILKFTLGGVSFPSMKREDSAAWNNYFLFGGNVTASSVF